MNMKILFFGNKQRLSCNEFAKLNLLSEKHSFDRVFPVLLKNALNASLPEEKRKACLEGLDYCLKKASICKQEKDSKGTLNALTSANYFVYIAGSDVAADFFKLATENRNDGMEDITAALMYAIEDAGSKKLTSPLYEILAKESLKNGEFENGLYNLSLAFEFTDSFERRKNLIRSILEIGEKEEQKLVDAHKYGDAAEILSLVANRLSHCLRILSNDIVHKTGVKSDKKYDEIADMIKPFFSKINKAADYYLLERNLKKAADLCNFSGGLSFYAGFEKEVHAVREKGTHICLAAADEYEKLGDLAGVAEAISKAINVLNHGDLRKYELYERLALVYLRMLVSAR